MKKITLLMLIAFSITAQSQNKLLSDIREYYDGSTWQNNYANNYEYDSNNNLITESEFSWEDNAWKTRDKTTYTYNASNKVTQALYQGWDSETLTFSDSYRDLYTYTNGRLTTIEGQEWTGSKWLNEYKFTVTYNGNNLPNVVVEYYWENSQWVNEERTTYTYNANNIVISDVFEEWVGGQWVNSEKTVYTYNANNKLITDRGANWDDFNEEWEGNGDKTEYEWDATGNKTQDIEYYSNSQYKEDYTYDTTKLMSSFAHPFKDKTGVDYFGEGDFPYVNKILTENEYRFNNFTNSFEISARTTYNYNSAITLSTDTFKKEVATITVYPNPTQDFLNIQNESNTTIDKVIVTDFTGKKVLEQNNANQVDVRNLAKGIYVIQALSGKDKFFTKFIKE